MNIRLWVIDSLGEREEGDELVGEPGFDGGCC